MGACQANTQTLIKGLAAHRYTLILQRPSTLIPEFTRHRAMQTIIGIGDTGITITGTN